MTHPIVQLQSALVTALRAELEPPVFDAPPKETSPPYVAIARHDVLPRDGDAAPGHEHRLLLVLCLRHPAPRGLEALEPFDRVGDAELRAGVAIAH